MNATKSESLTRAELEADHVAAGVAKWGNEERDNLQRQAVKKSLETLRVDYDLRHSGETEALAASKWRQRNETEVMAAFGLEGNS